MNLKRQRYKLGNAYQFVRWGDALKEAGIRQKSLDAYHEALKKEPDNLQALWGAAQIEMQIKKIEIAKSRCQKILDIDPEYKFGDVSLLFCKNIV